METTMPNEKRGFSASTNEGKSTPNSWSNAFCNIMPDVFGDFAKPLFSKPFANVMHASNVECDDLCAALKFAVAKTLDDLVCVGITNNIMLASTFFYKDEFLKDEIWQTIQKITSHLESQHIRIFWGDYQVGKAEHSTVGITAAARIRQSEIIGNERIQDGDVIIGLAGADFVGMTYMPIIKAILENFRPSIHGLVHCADNPLMSLNFVNNLRIVKDNLFPVTDSFSATKDDLGLSWEEMFKQHNPGHGFEIFTKEKIADEVIKIAQYFEVKAKIIGHCEAAPNKALTVKTEFGTFTY